MSPAGRRPVSLSVAVTLLYLLLVTFPGYYWPIGAGPDDGWVYEVNRLAQSRWSGVVFTWGPLAYLLVPFAIGSNLLVANSFHIFIHLLFALLIYANFRQSRSPYAMFFFAAGSIFAHAFGLHYDYQLLTVFGLLVLFRPDRRGFQVANATLAGVLAALALLIKFNLGATALGMLAIAGFCRLWDERSSPAAGVGWLERLRRSSELRTFIGPAALGAASTALVLVWAYLAPLGNFLDWLRFSLDISLCYSTVQSVPGPLDLLVLGLLALALYAATAHRIVRQQASLYDASWIFALLLFMAFKGGFVRQDGHELSFFPAVVCVLSALLLLARSEAVVRLISLSLVLSIGLGLPAAARYAEYNDLPKSSELIFAQRGLEQIGKLFRWSEVRQDLAAQSVSAMDRLRLPDSVVVSLRDHTVGVVPFTQTLCFVNRLRCQPNPILQGYAGGSMAIDRWSAEHYLGDAAPEFLFFEFLEVDERHPLWGLPATAQAILRRYRIVDLLPQLNMLLLARSEVPPPPEPDPLLVTAVPPDGWVEVPATNRALLACPEMRLTPWGRLRGFLLRVPPVWIVAETASGATRTYRMLPGTAGSGLLMNFLPADIRELTDLLEGRVAEENRVVRFRIAGPGADYYRSEVVLRWRALDLPGSG